MFTITRRNEDKKFHQEYMKKAIIIAPENGSRKKLLEEDLAADKSGLTPGGVIGNWGSLSGVIIPGGVNEDPSPPPPPPPPPPSDPGVFGSGSHGDRGLAPANHHKTSK